MPQTLELSTTQDVRDGLVPAAFNEWALRDGLTYVRRTSVPAAELTLEKLVVLGDVELAAREASGCAVVLRLEPDMLVELVGGRGHGKITVAGKNRAAVDAVLEDMVAALREEEPEDEVPVTFWANCAGRPANPRRHIRAPAWSEIRMNYGAPARNALDELMAANGPGPGGLLLWHGEPGTGKSYALRALAREWRGWCDTHFITDADAFLGATSYLLDALLRGDRGDRTSRAGPRWRLIVLEDSGELLAADARAVAGQALSRLLNLSDGLLGEGLRVIVLVTTNEPLRRLHPAVVRPGRTWMELEFNELSVDEANAWLASRRSDRRVARRTTLAELFAHGDGRRLPARHALGFAASRSLEAPVEMTRGAEC